MSAGGGAGKPSAAAGAASLPPGACETHTTRWFCVVSVSPACSATVPGLADTDTPAGPSWPSAVRKISSSATIQASIASAAGWPGGTASTEVSRPPTARIDHAPWPSSSSSRPSGMPRPSSGMPWFSRSRKCRRPVTAPPCTRTANRSTKRPCTRQIPARSCSRSGASAASAKPSPGVGVWPAGSWPVGFWPAGCWPAVAPRAESSPRESPPTARPPAESALAPSPSAGCSPTGSGPASCCSAGTWSAGTRAACGGVSRFTRAPRRTAGHTRPAARSGPRGCRAPPPRRTASPRSRRRPARWTGGAR